MAQCRYARQCRPEIPGVPDTGTGRAADRVGTHLPGDLERRAGATPDPVAGTPLDPAISQAMRGTHRSPRSIPLGSRPARAMRTTDPAGDGPGVRQLVEPAAPSRRPRPAQTRRHTVGVIPRPGRHSGETEPEMGAGPAPETRTGAVPAIPTGRRDSPQRHSQRPSSPFRR